MPSSWLRTATAEDAGDVLTVRLQIHRAAVHVRKPLPGLLLADDPALVQISVEPRIVLLQNALTAAECQVLVRVTALIVRFGSSRLALVWSSRQFSYDAMLAADGHADHVYFSCSQLDAAVSQALAHGF